MEQIALWGGFILTLMVFSYILGDNILYRLAIYVFVGLVAGTITIVTVEGVLIPWINAALVQGDVGAQVVGIIPLILGGLLMLKAVGRLHRLANLALAFVIGIGTAVAVIGAISGTLLPLSGATASVEVQASAGDLVNSFLIVVGVVCTLFYFQYAARRIPGSVMTRRGLLVRSVAAIGEGVIVVTLGALYGGAILSGLVIFSERIASLLTRLLP